MIALFHNRKDKMHIETFSGKYPSLLIFGPPGVGKGTLCKFIAGNGLYHLSSGDIFRGLSKESPAGKIFHSFAGSGFLVPDDVTLAIWHNYVEGLISTNRYFPKQQYLLLDGIPRTVAQAKMLGLYVDIKAIIVLEVEHKEELIKRLQRRALIEKRADDADEKVLWNRLEVYERETSIVLNSYPKELIYRVNAEQRPLEVVRDTLIKTAHILAYPPTHN